MANETNGKESALSGFLEIVIAIMLGLATIAGAFAAYQSSLWGGNCLTAYNMGVNEMTNANGEYIKGMMDISFDANVFIETIKEEQNIDKQTPAAVPATPREGENAEEAAQVKTSWLMEELKKLISDELNEATAWSWKMEENEKESLTEEEEGGIYEASTDIESEIEVLETMYNKRIQELVDHIREAEIEKESTKLIAQYYELNHENPTADEKKSAGELEAQIKKLDEEYEKMMLKKDTDEKIVKIKANLLEKKNEYFTTLSQVEPVRFFDQPEYSKKTFEKSQKLRMKAEQLMTNGQVYNFYGDQYTLSTVLFTIVLFFAGIAAVVRRNGIKITFLLISLVVFGYTMYQMVYFPFAALSVPS